MRGHHQNIKKRMFLENLFSVKFSNSPLKDSHYFENSSNKTFNMAGLHLLAIPPLTYTISISPLPS
jgi:hypothetical protein